MKTLELTHLDGQKTLYDFKNRKNWGRIFFINSLVLSLLFIAPIFLFNKGPYYALHGLQLTLIIVMIFYAVFDYHHWSDRSYSPRTQFISPENKIPRFEMARYYFFKLWWRPLGDLPPQGINLKNDRYAYRTLWQGIQLCSPHLCQIADKDELKNILSSHPTKTRVVFMGTSQTFGVGAPSINTTFFSLTYQLLGNPDLLFINLSSLGSSSFLLKEEYEELFKKIDPHYFIINLSYNDLDHSFRQGLEGLIHLGQEMGSKIILLQEASSPEHENKNIEEKHHMIRDLAHHHSLTFLPWHDYLAQQQSQHQQNLWFDIVHLNQRGHQLGALYLAHELGKIFKN